MITNVHNGQEVDVSNITIRDLLVYEILGHLTKEKKDENIHSRTEGSSKQGR